MPDENWRSLRGANRPARVMMLRHAFPPVNLICSHAHESSLYPPGSPAGLLEPMQVALRGLPDGGKWTYEAKLDGYRCLAARRSSGVVLWLRRGNGFTDRFPQIVRACEKLPADTLIDGEVIVVDENGRCTFNALPHSRPKAHISSMPLMFSFTASVTCSAYRSRNGGNYSRLRSSIPSDSVSHSMLNPPI